MAALHASVATARSVPVTPPHVHSPIAHNPFLNADPVSAPLRPANPGSATAAAVEIAVLWGTTVLAALQLSPPRAYVSYPILLTPG